MKHLLIALLTLALTLAFCVFACAQVRSEALTTLNTLRLAQIQSGRIMLPLPTPFFPPAKAGRRRSTFSTSSCSTAR